MKRIYFFLYHFVSCFLVFNIFVFYGYSQIISTFAGTKFSSGYSGDGSLAQYSKLSYPIAVATDNNGNVYISDANNNVIRKVNAAGIITTIAGNGTKGYSGDGSMAINAELNMPMGLVIDANGNIYFSDQGNNVIRKVSTSGIISTVVGNGSIGYSGDGSLAINASLSAPTSVTVDKTNNLYVADNGNNVIRKVNPSGIITTFAGNGTQGYSGDNSNATLARISAPRDVVLDGLGNLYFSDPVNSVIRKIDPSGIITTFAGKGTQGYFGDGSSAISAEFQAASPLGLAMDNLGNVYTADYGNHVIRKINGVTGIISTIAGTGISGYSGDGGIASAAQLWFPIGVAVDNSGNIYITDTYNNTIRKINTCVSPSINAEPSDISTCVNSSAIFSVNSVDGNSYQWQINTGNSWVDILDNTIYSGSKTQSLNILTVSANMNNYKFRCLVYNNCGFTPSTDASLQILPSNIIPSISISCSKSTICQNENISFIAISANGGSLPTYQWKINGLNVGTNSSSFTTNNLADGDTVTCQLSSNAVCVITNNIISNAIVIRVNSNVSPAINISITSTNICSNTSSIFSAAISNGGSSPSYQWKINNVNAGTDSSTFTTNNLNNGDIISCQLTSNAACATTNTATSNSVIVTVNKSPVVSISGDTCVGGVLKVTSDIAMESIKWQLNSSNVSIQNAGFKTNATTVAGGNGAGFQVNQLNNPDRLYVDANGIIYVPDLNNNRVEKWLPGAVNGITVAGGNGQGSAANQFDRPTGLYVDKNGAVYIADQNNNRVQKWLPGATSGTTVAQYLNGPTDVFVDDNLNVYVSEQFSSKVTKWLPGSSSGIIVAGNGNYGYATDLNKLSSPTGIYVDANGSVYVCDTDNDRIVKWLSGATTGIVVAGGNGHGTMSNQLSNPLGIYVDASENIFIADYGSNAIIEWKKNATSGSIVAGGNGIGFNANQFNHPYGVFFDGSNNLYVSDMGNNRVQKFAYNIVDTIKTSTSGNYTATVVTAAGCSATSNIINVVPYKTPAITISSSAAFLCPNVPMTFTATPLYGGDNPLYQWKINGLNTGTNSNIFSSSSLNAGDKISCEMTSNANLCLTTNHAISNSITLINNPAPVPVLNITASDTAVCETKQVNFLTNSSHTGTNRIFQWYINGIANGNPINSTSEAQMSVINMSNHDAISCVLTSNNGCVVSVNSNNIIMTVDKVPSIIFVPDTVIYNGSGIKLNPIIASNDFASYKWSPSAYLDSDTIQNPIATPVNTITYKLDVATKYGCTASGNITLKIIDIIIPNAFSPNGDNINDRWKITGLPFTSDCTVDIFDRNGSPIFHSVGYEVPWDGTVNNKPVPIATYYYVIKVKSLNKVLTGSITILR